MEKQEFSHALVNWLSSSQTIEHELFILEYFIKQL
jgi:hypothetical protein